MVTALFLLADLAGWSSCCPGLFCWEALEFGCAAGRAQCESKGAAGDPGEQLERCCSSSLPGPSCAGLACPLSV